MRPCRISRRVFQTSGFGGTLARQAKLGLRQLVFSLAAAAPAMLLFALAFLFLPLPAAEAAPESLTLICPSDGSSEPFFEDQNGSRLPITNLQIKALAVKACNPSLLGGSDQGTVRIVNARPVPIFVGFTTSDHKPGPITWGAGCAKSGRGAKIEAGAVCVASVISNAVASRFCATLNAAPADCFHAQENRQTMVETVFEPASNPGCFNKGNCVWFDISVIPSTCTDALWKQNQCANTGGASYNLPVSIACNGKTVYTCQGPPGTAYGPANYPSKCGNPNSQCQGGPNCQNAYFYPMFEPPENKYQPNTVCLSGQVLTIRFLAGP